jgi:hypothetical protein
MLLLSPEVCNYVTIQTGNVLGIPKIPPKNNNKLDNYIQCISIYVRKIKRTYSFKRIFNLIQTQELIHKS